jgi:hypothetical protein
MIYPLSFDSTSALETADEEKNISRRASACPEKRDTGPQDSRCAAG